jgi:Tfp pilus assembly protein PilV
MTHRCPNPIDRRPRRGITLLEVVIAMAIFVMTLPALNALVLLGMQRAEETKIMTMASLQCRSKMAEIMCGAAPFSNSDWSALDDPNWQWKADASGASGVAGLQTIQVSVKLDLGNGQPYQQTLIQMVLDPSSRGSTQDRYLLDPTAGSSSSSSTTTGGTAASGTAAGGTAAGGTGAAAGGGTAAAGGGLPAAKTGAGNAKTGAATGKTGGTGAAAGGMGAGGMGAGGTGAAGMGGGAGAGNAGKAAGGGGKGGGR